MKSENIEKKIGLYKILKNLGRGGMGEVFLVYDPFCERKIALKKIRSDLQHKKGIYERFLKEARIASKLTHPSIIPIYSIEEDPHCTYYTMPYIEGDTLKNILKKADHFEKNGEDNSNCISSISNLCRIFLSICEAVAYTHEKGILHRDLKPENFMIGRFGEVMILDWGIADSIEASAKKAILNKNESIAGTIAYLAPERALNHPSSVYTEIYALGIILYQILTLKLPFHRNTIPNFKKSFHLEKFIDPIEIAPYREIPPQLAEITKKCLSFDAKDRYPNVKELISDLKNTIEGKSKWIELSLLNINNKNDWSYEENIFLTKHLAISKNMNYSEWATLLISKKAFAGNLKIEGKVRFLSENSSLGVLFNIPELSEKTSFEEGYNLWISPSSFQLLRKNLPVLEIRNFQDLNLKDAAYFRIEKIENQVDAFLNDQKVLSYTSHLPLVGPRIGLLYKDQNFELEDLKIFSGSHTLKVNCLAVADAFFTYKQYENALLEYRRIGNAFPGRAEGRIALFRAGLTIVEKLKFAPSKKKKKILFQQALDEFSNLHLTPGAPLDYLGKSIVYAAMDEDDEEAKCLELTFRKFPKHPLLSSLKQHLLYRIHESSLQDRRAAFRMILLLLRYFPKMLQDKANFQLITSLEKNLDPLYFLLHSDDKILDLCIQLSFWVGKKHILLEIFERLLTKQAFYQVPLENIIFSFLQMEDFSNAKAIFQKIKPLYTPSNSSQLIEIALLTNQIPLEKLLQNLFSSVEGKYLEKEMRVLLFLLEKAVLEKSFATFALFQKTLPKLNILEKDIFLLDTLSIEICLLQKKPKEAWEIFKKYPQEKLFQETSFLYPLYGFYLALTKGKQAALNHFATALDASFLPIHTLISSFLYGEKKALFYWEKKQLHRQLFLFYFCLGLDKQAKSFNKKLHVTN